MKKYLLFPLFIVFATMFISCDKDDPVIDNEEELITSVSYTLTPANGGAAVTLSFVDIDGDGGNDPIVIGGTLAANQMYTGAISLLNESESPAENITEEIEEEKEEHQFFFQSTVAGLNVTYSDQDADMLPVGLSTELSTGAANTGTLTITLRHQPNKTATGVSTGDITNAGGETDIEITFPIDVQ